MPQFMLIPKQRQNQERTVKDSSNYGECHPQKQIYQHIISFMEKKNHDFPKDANVSLNKITSICDEKSLDKLVIKRGFQVHLGGSIS